MEVFSTATLCLFHIIALYLRSRKTSGTLYIFDYFVIFLGFNFLYVVGGQLTTIKYDHFNGMTLHAVSIFSLIYTFTVCLLTPLFPAPIRKHSIEPCEINESLNTGHLIYLVTGVVLLVLGYLFWSLNYSRIGGLIDGIFQHSNRVDRNALLTEKRGNLPYTHFFFAGQCFVFYGLLLIRRNVVFSLVTVILLCSPFLLFFVFEGERSSLLKHILGLSVVLCLARQDLISLKLKHLVLIAILFLAFALMGNVRSFVVNAIVNNDFAHLIRRLSTAQLGLFLPNEFPAILFSLKESIWLWQQGDFSFGYGYSYFQSFSYLFPRSVHDLFFINKTATLADQFASNFGESIGNERKMGLGLSPLAESFSNFSWFGGVIGPLIILLFAKIHNWLSKQFGVVGFATIITLPVFILLNRTSFASCVSFTIYVAAISVTVFWALQISMAIIDKELRKRKIKRS